MIENLKEKNEETNTRITEKKGTLPKNIFEKNDKINIEKKPEIYEEKKRLPDIFENKIDETLETEENKNKKLPDIFDKDFEEYRTYAAKNKDEKIESTQSKELTVEEKEKIKQETGWSDEIINSINSMEEYKIYKEAGLMEAEINGKKCLIRNDIDWQQKDERGRTNKERADQGLSPINKDGKVIELHHIGQKSDSPLAELTPEQHRGKGNDDVLHDKKKESEINRQEFSKERNEHWATRAA